MALIISVFDYGSQTAYGSAARSHLKTLYVIQAQTMRVCSGAFKTSPVPAALQAEMGEMPLRLRRKQLMVNYWANLQGHSDFHLTKEALQECWENGKSQRENWGRVDNDVANELGVLGVRMSCSSVSSDTTTVAWVARNTGIC